MTLGPKGRNAIIAQPYGAPKITKDGVTVAKSTDFEDAFEDMGTHFLSSSFIFDCVDKLEILHALCGAVV